MELRKANWTSSEDNFSLSMSLTKVDKANRIVSGWASLDNPDLQDDVVLAEASEKAFAKFRGNVREMHQPVAVGRMIDYRPDTYYDVKTQKFYNGIFVKVYVSKGAQNTWEKVLDGTLQAFSIKGPITDYELEFSKDIGKPLRIIKGYELEELSLVDSGGNQLANVVSITKTNGSVLIKGMMVDTYSENVFYCFQDKIAKTSSEDLATCPEGHNMTNIGWFEYDNENKAEKISELITKYNSSNTNVPITWTSPSTTITFGTNTNIVAKQVEPVNNEGGVNVAEETKTPEAGSSVPNEVEVTEQGKADTGAVQNEEVTVEEVSTKETVTESEQDFAKILDDLKKSVQDGIEKSASQTGEAITLMQGTVTQISETLDKELDELRTKHDELSQRFGTVAEKLEDVEKRIDGVEKGTAIKKSGDLGGSTEEKLSKSLWGGHFLSASQLSD